LLREKDSKLVKISREGNKASHELAKIGKVYVRSEFWLWDSPPEIAAILATDCNPVEL
jgi:hypothetical protein